MSSILTAGIVVRGSASAGPIVNEKFDNPSDSFFGWSGDIIGDDGVGDFFPISDPDDTSEYSAYGANFEHTIATLTEPNKITLKTSEELDDDIYYDIFLYQTFTLDSLTSSISFDLEAIFGIETQISALLIDPFNPNTILEELVFEDSFSSSSGSLGGTFDITSYAGQDVLLAFNIVDFDGVGSSSLTISKINIVSVPEPSTLLLFTAALFATIRKSKLITK
jgi:hypothetical protein